MKSRPIDLLTRSGFVIELNYCPVCKRECRGDPEKVRTPPGLRQQVDQAH